MATSDYKQKKVPIFTTLYAVKKQSFDPSEKEGKDVVFFERRGEERERTIGK
jgi:hypothetical protein